MKTSQYIRQEKAIAGHDGFVCRAWPELHPECQQRIADEATRLMAPFRIGHIYVLQFASGVVKVGKTTNPKQRLATHVQLAEIHGGDVCQSWVSAPHCGYTTTERELIAFCSRSGRVAAGKEYFHIDFDSARQYADFLAHNRLSSDDLDAALSQVDAKWLEAHGRLPVDEQADQPV